MKRFVPVVFALLVLSLSAPGQSQSVDWRTLVSERDRDFIENWERHFELLLAKVEAHDRPQAHDLTAGQLRALKAGTAILNELGPRQFGHWPCRKIESVWFSTETLNWFGCRIRTSSDSLVLEKRSGTEFFSGKLLPDPTLGVVFVGHVWGNLETERPYGQNPLTNAVGVLRRSGPRALRLFIVGDYRLTIVDIEMRWRIPN